MGEVTHSDGPEANRYIDIDNASVDSLRDAVHLDAETREQVGKEIVALIDDERTPVTEIEEAERLALQRVAQEQFFDTSKLLTPSDDPAFY